MRNPNGFGSITRLKNRKLRKPYCVRISFMQSGKQVRKCLGYYKTKEEALHALETYHINHFDADFVGVSFQDLWQKWVNTKLLDETLAESTRRGYHYSFAKIPDEIKNKTFVNITFDNLQEMFNALRTSLGYDSLRKIRGDISQLYDYAINNKIVSANFVPNIDIGSSRKKGEVLTFTDDQIKKLWNDYKNDNGNEQAKITIKIVLMLIYNGCRISEFLSLKTNDVNLSERYFEIKDSKTENGIRKVPIHKDLLEIYQSFYDKNNTYFLTCKGTKSKYTYANFRDSYWDELAQFYKWQKELTPHNCRKTCSSLLKRFEADSMYHKLILGHSGALNLTERVYTNVSVEKLVETINKIPNPAGL